MGLEGFSGNQSILYHLVSPCRIRELGEFVPIVREEWVPDAHAHRHMRTYRHPGGWRRGGRPPAPDVEQRRGDLACRPTDQMEWFYRNGEGDEVVFIHEGSGTLETIFGDVPYREGDYIVIPRGTTYRFAFETPQRHLVFESPGPDRDPAALPQRVRAAARARALLPPRHPPADGAEDLSRPRPLEVKVRVKDGYQPYVLDYHPFDVVGWDGYVYPWTFNDPRLRADHGADPHAAAVAPDLPGPELRRLLVLPAQAGLRSARDPDPVPPLEPELGGDALLRRRQLLRRGRASRWRR